MILSFISCPFTAIPYFTLFDDAVSGREKLYQNHVEIRLFHHNELDSLDDTLQKGCMLCCLQTTNSVCR